LSEEFVESYSNFISRDEGEADQNSVMERDLELRDKGDVIEPSLVGNSNPLRKEVRESALTLLELTKLLLGCFLLIANTERDAKEVEHLLDVCEIDSSFGVDLACELRLYLSSKTR
jgi:hypothetical protein